MITVARAVRAATTSRHRPATARCWCRERWSPPQRCWSRRPAWSSARSFCCPRSNDALRRREGAAAVPDNRGRRGAPAALDPKRVGGAPWDPSARSRARGRGRRSWAGLRRSRAGVRGYLVARGGFEVQSPRVPGRARGERARGLRRRASPAGARRRASGRSTTTSSSSTVTAAGPPTAAQWAALRRSLSGGLVLPEQPAYDTARLVYDLRYEHGDAGGDRLRRLRDRRPARSSISPACTRSRRSRAAAATATPAIRPAPG